MRFRDVLKFELSDVSAKAGAGIESTNTQTFEHATLRYFGCLFVSESERARTGLTTAPLTGVPSKAHRPPRTRRASDEGLCDTMLTRGSIWRSCFRTRAGTHRGGGPFELELGVDRNGGRAHHPRVDLFGFPTFRHKLSYDFLVPRAREPPKLDGPPSLRSYVRL